MSPRFSLSNRTVFVVAGALSATIGAFPAMAQTIHPDWSQVWNGQSQPSERGQMTVPTGAVVPIALDRALSSSSARVGDIVTATPISRVAGDSEFPPGTRIGGVVSQADPASGTTPGVLDIDFQSALLPDGTDVPLRGFISSLDESSVQTRGGHIIAREGKQTNSLTAVGIGGGLGFVLGRLLRTRTLVPTILGAAGGYLYARDNKRFAEDARIAAGTTLGVRLDGDVSFPDTSDYASVRLNFLETHQDTRPSIPTWRSEVSASPRADYPEYVVVETRPSWVYADPFDFYGFPFYTQPFPSYGYAPYGYGYAPYSYGYPRRDYRHDGDDNRRRDINTLPRFGDGVPFRPSRNEGNHFGDNRADFGRSFGNFNSVPQLGTHFAPKPFLPAPRFDTPRERPTFSRPSENRPAPSSPRTERSAPVPSQAPANPSARRQGRR